MGDGDGTPTFYMGSGASFFLTELREKIKLVSNVSWYIALGAGAIFLILLAFQVYTISSIFVQGLSLGIAVFGFAIGFVLKNI